MSKKKITIIAILIAVILTPAIFIYSKTPSNDRDWNIDQQILPYAEINGSEVTIYNIRNINYRSETDFDVNYYDRTFDLEKIKTVDYMVELFEDWRGPAHTLLSFGFENDEYIAISVEIRKEKGEDFSPWKGLIREYEVTYVIADEKDVIKLRTNYRKDETFLYPIKISKEKAQELFLDMVTRASDLKENPEFYNTITSTCMTNIIDHVNKITDNPIEFSYKTILPGYSDEIALEHGLIDTNLTLEKAREKFQINKRAEQYAEDPNFSVKIRSERSLNEDEALSLLTDTIVNDYLYDSFTTLECLDFYTDEVTEEYVEFSIREIHGSDCKGDPNTSPRVDTYKVMKQTKNIFYQDWKDGSYLPYDPLELRR